MNTSGLIATSTCWIIHFSSFLNSNRTFLVSNVVEQLPHLRDTFCRHFFRLGEENHLNKLCDVPSLFHTLCANPWGCAQIVLRDQRHLKNLTRRHHSKEWIRYDDLACRYDEIQYIEDVRF